jgi:hypothetical protein
MEDTKFEQNQIAHETQSNNSGITYAAKGLVSNRPEDLKTLLLAIAPFVTHMNPERWIQRVYVSDQTQMKDFDLRPEYLAAIAKVIGVEMTEETYLHSITARMAPKNMSANALAEKFAGEMLQNLRTNVAADKARRAAQAPTPREPVIHNLKTHPGPFGAVRVGIKHHEVRKFDRDYRVGDTVFLHEYDPHTELYSGLSIPKQITYISLPGTWGLPEGLGILSLGEPKNLPPTSVTTNYPDPVDSVRDRFYQLLDSLSWLAIWWASFWACCVFLGTVRHPEWRSPLSVNFFTMIAGILGAWFTSARKRVL